MPNPWKEPKALAKLLDIKPGDAREVLRQNPNVLKEARAAKRNGQDPRSVLQTSNDEPSAEDEKTTATSPAGLEHLQAVKALYEGTRNQDIADTEICFPKQPGKQPTTRSKTF